MEFRDICTQTISLSTKGVGLLEKEWLSWGFLYLLLYFFSFIYTPLLTGVTAEQQPKSSYFLSLSWFIWERERGEERALGTMKSQRGRWVGHWVVKRTHVTRGTVFQDLPWAITRRRSRHRTSVRIRISAGGPPFVQTKGLGISMPFPTPPPSPRLLSFPIAPLERTSLLIFCSALCPHILSVQIVLVGPTALWSKPLMWCELDLVNFNWNVQ